MCIVSFVKDGHPDYPFVFIANRDESYDRPAAPIHRWVDAPEVTAGMDFKARGTWLGYTARGKFIAVLNHPFTDWQPSLEIPRSRGQLLRDYLTSEISIADFEEQLRATRKEYETYHLVYGTFEELKYYSNYEDVIRSLNSGVHVLANTEDDLSLNRTKRLKGSFSNYVVARPEVFDLDQLLSLLQDDQVADEMRDFPAEIDAKLAQKHSSVFIRGEDFGTVGSTVILLDKEGKITVKELKYDRQGVTEKTTLEQQLELTDSPYVTGE